MSYKDVDPIKLAQEIAGNPLDERLTSNPLGTAAVLLEGALEHSVNILLMLQFFGR